MEILKENSEPISALAGGEQGNGENRSASPQTSVVIWAPPI